MSPGTIHLLRTSADHPAFISLVAQLDTELSERYGDVQKTYNQFNVLPDIDTVVLAFDGEAAIACGCFKKYDAATTEIKRMYVVPYFRGKGIARRIVSELEVWSADLGYSATILETGEKQPEAIFLYQRMGYHRIENFGPYKNLASSVCFSKSISKNIVS